MDSLTRALALLVFALAWTSTTHAYPTDCKPSAGGAYSCVSKVTAPYRYTFPSCDVGEFYSSESAAFARDLEVNWSGSSICNLTTNRIGWFTSTGWYARCGTGFNVPAIEYGTETQNASQYTFEWTDCFNHQEHEQTSAPVLRVRNVGCPDGYTGQSGYCYRASTQRDLHKNLGSQCPTCGNPISIGIGGKHQEEQDYVGPGRLPLEFSRHYNNLLTSAAWYSVSNFPGTLAERVQMASNPDDHARQLIGMDRMGVLWRHSYQRAIVIRATADLETAAAYRPDGRVHAFNNYNGTYVADADVTDKLTKLVDGTWRYETAKGEQVEEYNADGRLTKIVDRTGVFQALAYDSCDLLRTVTDNFGRTLTLEYTATCTGVPNTAYRVSSVTDPDGGVTSFTYDSDGRLSQVTYPDTGTRTYHYESSVVTELTGITDENNDRFATWSYDGNRRANSSTHAGGADQVSIVYTPASPCTGCSSGTVTSAVVTDAAGAARTYSFSIVQGVSRVTSLVQPAASGSGTVSQTYTYDANGNITSRKDFNGNRTCYAFDLARNLETVRVEGFASGISCPANLTTYTPTAGTRQRKISTQWHSTFRIPTQIDEVGKRMTFTHDANGNVLTKTVLDTATSASRTWNYTYNSFGKILTSDGPRTDVSDVTTYTYYGCTTGYECGQIETITNALGHVTTYNTYNAHGQPLTITDPNGVATTLAYDGRQRLTSRTVGSELTSFEYWPTGLVKKVTLPDASFLEYTYDAAHRLTEIEDSEGNRIVYTLDAMGNRTAENLYDPSSTLTQTRTRVFNALNRLWKELGAAGTSAVTTTFAYDNNGNQTGINAPLSRNTVNAYDELNRLKQVADPLSGITQYGYNALDQLISVTDPRSKVTSYAYNALGDLTQQVSPDTGTTANTYDSGGNLATSTDARSKTGTYAYDALNRVASLTYPDQTIGYAYDAGTNQKGRLTQLTDASGSTSWTYDTQGRVLSRQQSMGVTKTLGYAYDSFGRLQTLTLPSGNTITYGYTDGKVTSLTLNGSTTILSSVQYQPFGPTRGWTWGNSTLAIREYDTDGKIAEIDSAGVKTYGYDDAFRITGITDAANSSLSQTYGYDLLDRLTSATGTSLSQGWTYDANGNRLTQTGSAASTYTVSSTSNRLSSVSGVLSRSYSYDNSGNTTADGTATFTYNDAGRMVSATKASVTTTYALNALGQRMKKATSGTSTYFVYDEAGHLIGEYNTSGNLIQETAWLGDIPVATLRPNGGGTSLFYVHTDHLNTPRRISRPSDNVVVWRWDADPFGTTVANEDPDADSTQFVYALRFPGQYLDAETGVHYNYMRDYDPAVGRYVESDPIGLEGGLNTYAYVAGNPVDDFDLFGLSGKTERIPGGNPTTVRVDKPHVPGQQTHAHVCEKGCKEIVVNKDGTGSHGTDPKKLKNKVKDFLRKKGFKLVVCPPFLEDIVLLIAAEECRAGDPISCRTFQDLGGTIEGPIG